MRVVRRRAGAECARHPRQTLRDSAGRIQSIVVERRAQICSACASVLVLVGSRKTAAATQAVKAKGWRGRQLGMFDDTAFKVGGHRLGRGWWEELHSIPQDVALWLQLVMIAGNEPSTSYVELRVFNFDMTPASEHRTFVGVREPERAVALVAKLASTHHVYLSCAPRTAPGGTKDLVGRAWCLWVDCDDVASVDRLRDFRPLPSMVVRSSADHVYAFWQLSRPLPGANIRRANRRLALALGADRNACDAARVLRPILSRNHKYDPPATVECLRLELSVFGVTDVVGSLPDDPAELPRRRHRGALPSAPTRIDGSSGRSPPPSPAAATLC